MISAGQPDLINQNAINNPRATKIKIQKTLYDQYIQDWHSKLDTSSKGRNYKLFNQDIKLEPYLTNLNKNVYIPIIKFRTANFKLPIELGRWDGTPTADRKDLGQFPIQSAQILTACG